MKKPLRIIGVCILSYVVIGYILTFFRDTYSFESENFVVNMSSRKDINDVCIVDYEISLQEGVDELLVGRMPGNTESFIKSSRVFPMGIPNIWHVDVSYDVLITYSDILITRDAPLELSKEVDFCSPIGWSLITLHFAYIDDDRVVRRDIVLFR